MAKTFFFYDLETSGLSPQEARVMQFAGIRTDMDLQPIGEPINVLVKLNDDVLPSPEALMVTNITPQQTQADGYKESDFARMLSEEVFTPDTIAVGFNNIRFDDEIHPSFILAQFLRSVRVELERRTFALGFARCRSDDPRPAARGYRVAC